jgi:CheY-like chemotaxis protein
MSTLKLLLVEDDQNEIKTFNNTLERYCSQFDKKVELTTKSTLEESQKALSNSFDGAIIDIKLNKDEDAGNKLIDDISKNYRIPVAVYTGNPDDVNNESGHIKVFKRGVGYDEPLNFLFEIYSTGLTKIFGGRGDIEQKMNRIFWNNVLPNLAAWKAHNAKGKDTEKALLRYIVNHISELIDEDVDEYFPEEMYISPVISSTIRTGGIVKKKNADEYYVVLSPACDLALHKGNFKTDRIMVCFIEKLEMSIVRSARADETTVIHPSDNAESRKSKTEKIEKAKRILWQLKRNNNSAHYHYLPKTILFHGGFVNFRKIETFLPSEFSKNFDAPSAQISSAFTKDVVARFSSYYARQGQPDFDDHIL